MVRCPNESQTMKNKDSPNFRITNLEEKVAEHERTIAQQSATIDRLEQQMAALGSLFANAAQCLAVSPEPVHNYTNDNDTDENNNNFIKTEADSEVEVDWTRNISNTSNISNISPRNTSPLPKKADPPVQYNYKNLLQEHAVKQGWKLPILYETVKCPGGFSSTITLNDQTHKSDVQKSKVLAEKSAACLLLQSLKVIDENGIPVADGDPKRNSGVSKYSWCKNQLQEYFAKRQLNYPTYNIRESGGKGFMAEVSHSEFPETVIGPEGCSKRVAEQMAAHKAIVVWGVLDIPT